jgi:hypothetical protein
MTEYRLKMEIDAKFNNFLTREMTRRAFGIKADKRSENELYCDTYTSYSKIQK